MTTIKEAIAKYLDEGGDVEYLDTLVDEARLEWSGSRTFRVLPGHEPPWEGAQPGWYWGSVDGYGQSCGSSVGPFETEAEADEDLKFCVPGC